MDGSVSTLAPLFASAFATHDSFKAFLVGMAAAVGAGVSMGFAEALSDDGSLTGRGRRSFAGDLRLDDVPRRRRPHASYLIPNFVTATAIATVVVALELFAIAWIRNRYMDTPFLSARSRSSSGASSSS
jgi:hypothetical protein